MHHRFMTLIALSATIASAASLACFRSASATDGIQSGYFNAPSSLAPQGTTYMMPAQIFTGNTISDTTHPINFLNPASTFGAGLSTIGGTGFGGTGIGAYGSRTYFPNVYTPSSFGVSGYGLRYGVGGYGPGSYGGYGLGSYGGYGLASYGGYGLGSYGGYGLGRIGGAHHGTTPNRVIQTGPSPSSGNFYQPATADPSASGGYYASGGQPAPQAPAPVKTKTQPTNYWKDADDNWGAGGSPLPKDLNSVPWAK